MVNPTVDLLIQFGVMFGVGAVMGLALITMSHMLSPGSKNPNKLIPYECGVLPKGDARQPFNVHYYLVAVLFVIFDLEAVFLYPWAVALEEIGGVGLVAMLVFIALLIVGLFYEWKKGVLRWE